MPKRKGAQLAIRLPEDLLARVDRLVEELNRAGGGGRGDATRSSVVKDALADGLPGLEARAKRSK